MTLLTRAFHTLRRSEGFTLIELILVIAGVSAVAAILTR
jgi:type II secretory pathway pseudopilin PulG